MNEFSFGRKIKFDASGNPTINANILPSSSISYDLGSSSKRWRDLYLSGSTIDLNGTKISQDNGGGIKISDNSGNTLDGIFKNIIASDNIGIGTSVATSKLHIASYTTIVDPSDNQYPPIALTSDTETITGQPYGNGTYVCSSSSLQANNNNREPLEYIYSGTNQSSTWNSLHYYTTSGTYVGTNSVVATNGITYAGEWWQFQIPQPIQLTYCRFSSNAYSLVLLASLDGSSWDLIYLQSSANDFFSTTTININNSNLYNYVRVTILSTAIDYGETGEAETKAVVSGQFILKGKSTSTQSLTTSVSDNGFATFKASIGTNYTNTVVPNNSLIVEGNLGLGTNDPSYKLHVIGDTRIQGNLTVNGTTTMIDTEVQVTDMIDVVNDGTGPALRVTQTGVEPIADFCDDSSGNVVVRIADGGNVGIGTSNPLAKLHVQDTGAMILPSGTTEQQPSNPVAGMIRYNTTINKLQFYNSVNWVSIGAVNAAGGTIADIGGYRIHTFTSSGTFTVYSGGNIEYLIVGGGGAGGGGRHCGGGGGGAVYIGNINITSNFYSIVIGAGGTGAGLAYNTANPVANNGNNSSFGTLTAIGGGGGGVHPSLDISYENGQNGGCGGGGGHGKTKGFTVAVSPSFGFNGADSINRAACGGGGGGGQAGSQGTGAELDASGTGGKGGDGYVSNINGTSLYWAGGGGGSASPQTSTANWTGGNGGLGGGGGGALSSTAGTAGSGGGSALNSGVAGVKTTTTDACHGGNGGANTGGGGGGAGGWGSVGNGRGGSGGSGIVIIRYPL